MQSNSHILVIRLSAMGDVAMTVPVIRAFAKQHPKVRITFLSKAFLHPLFENIPNVNFYAADVKTRHKGVVGLFKLFKELRLLKITHVADLHNVLRSNILCTFFKFSLTTVAIIDKGRAEKKALTATKNKVFQQLKTSHQRYADVFQRLGFSIDISKQSSLKQAVLDKTTSEITKVKQQHWIGIAPFAAFESKVYPFQLMSQVVQKLSKEYQLFLFGGGDSEIHRLSELAAQTANCTSVAGKLTLKQELNLISHLDCMLAMDSGNAHFAAMQQIPTITLWGGTHPYAGFAPFHQPKDYCLLPDLKKYPKIPYTIYGNKTLEGYQDAMKTISVNTICNKIKEVVQKHS